jgi:hypothetical protein
VLVGYVAFRGWGVAATFGLGQFFSVGSGFHVRTYG